MTSHLSAMVGQGEVSYELERRLVRGCPSMVCRAIDARNAGSKGGRRAVNSGAVKPVMARKLPARCVTSSELGIATSGAWGEVIGPCYTTNLDKVYCPLRLTQQNPP